MNKQWFDWNFLWVFVFTMLSLCSYFFAFCALLGSQDPFNDDAEKYELFVPLWAIVATLFAICALILIVGQSLHAAAARIADRLDRVDGENAVRALEDTAADVAWLKDMAAKQQVDALKAKQAARRSPTKPPDR